MLNILEHSLVLWSMILNSTKLLTTCGLFPIKHSFCALTYTKILVSSTWTRLSG